MSSKAHIGVSHEQINKTINGNTPPAINDGLINNQSKITITKIIPG
jgi:hypothetical protein